MGAFRHENNSRRERKQARVLEGFRLGDQLHAEWYSDRKENTHGTTKVLCPNARRLVKIILFANYMVGTMPIPNVEDKNTYDPSA